jgi:hypothetical protein
MTNRVSFFPGAPSPAEAILIAKAGFLSARVSLHVGLEQLQAIRMLSFPYRY